jgi:hypothetical protein
MNQESILAVLPDRSEDARSMREIAQAVGLEVCTYIDWIKAERCISRALRKLIRWVWWPVTAGKIRRTIKSSI